MPDVRTILGRGVVTPLRRVGRDFVSGEGVEAVQTAIKQILLTRKGELPWNPDFGLDVERLRHTAMTETLLEEIQADIVSNIESFEPRASLVGIEIKRGGSDNPTAVFVTVRWVALATSTQRNTVITDEQVTEVQI